MASGPTPEAAGIIALALAFHRAPTRYPDLLHARTPLPPGVATLLRIAGGSEPEPGATALAQPEELKAAAQFFIEQVLLHHDASPYRVLGVESGAPPEQIKEHHRLLMRVFHPDREQHTDDWRDAFATRINLAYTALRDPHARRRHDGSAKPAAGTKASVPRRPVPRRARESGLPPWLLRHLPQWVLAGTALVACAVVGAVYLTNPRAPAVLADEAESLAASLRPAPPARPAPNPAPAAAVTTAPSPLERAAKASAGAAAAPAPATPPVRAATHGVRAVRPAPLAQGATPQAAATPAVPPPAARPAPVEIAPASGVVASATAVVAAPAPLKAAGTVPPDPNATLAQFMASYERGDTQAFMALFDELAIGKEGGKRQIRREHEALFQSTDLRHIEIDGMAWSQEGDLLHGKGHYQTTLMRKGELRLRTESGVLNIDLVRHGDRALIMGLDYQPGEGA